MRRRLSKLARVAAAIVVAVPGAAGCEAKVYGTPPQPAAPHLTVVVPQGNMAPVPEAPPDEPAAALSDLSTRVQQAAAQATEAGADISITVLDRHTRQLVSNENNEAMPIASVVKLFIADDMLLTNPQLSPEDRAMFEAMLRSSDDSAAEVFWNRGGGSPIITRVTDRYGLGTTTTPYNGRWFNTLSTTGDLVQYYDKLLSGSGGLPMDQANFIISNLAMSTPTAPDGTAPGGVYPQRFGIPEGLYSEQVAVKQGWFCCWNGGNWVHWSTGAVGADHRYVIAIASMQPADDVTARDTVTQAVKTMFPGGRI